MRLVCPNCDAQYEVSDDAIPETGRDVQCSNCGKTWFQPHANAEALAEEMPNQEWVEETAEVSGEEPEAEAPIPDDDVAQADEALQAESEGVSDHLSASDETSETVEYEAISESSSVDEAAEVSEEVAEDPETRPEPKSLDDGVAAILREEAEREQSARSAERNGGLETQPDLGIDAAPAAGSALGGVRERIARLRGTAPDAGQETSAPARGDMLPDIDEINSTLAATSDHNGEDGDYPPKARRRGFRLGFSLVLLLVVVGFLVYQYSPQIAERVPAAKPGSGCLWRRSR